ncbi:sugar porter family MFS transporter [candidate division KSB1 bacterium]|nr:sugar porter family MFS transporter [candidate division KSB1 bacterium]RQW02729.1 MAG: MFS transporter [candidate division KSB1 bacterium]
MNRRYVYFAAIVAALGGLLFGYDTAVIAGAIGYLRHHFALNAAQTGWAVSNALVGCILGVAGAGIMSDFLGRKKVLIFAAVLFTISAIGSALPATFAQFVIFRMIGGFGVGAASMVSPLFIAEISPPDMRGRLVSWNQFAIVFGMLVVYFVNYIVAGFGSEQWNISTGWRWMLGSETLPALLFFALLFFVPESPRWLIKQGRIDAGQRILAAIGGAEHARRQVEDIRTMAQESGSLLTLFHPGLKRILFVGIGLAILQQVTGINVIIYYAPEIFKGLGASSDSALLQTVVIGVFNLGFTIVAMASVDRVGRKPLMLIGATGMGFSLFVFGLAMYFRITAAWVLIFVLSYIASFALSVGPVTWVILAEIFPTSVRGRAMSICTILLWAANWLVSQTFPMLDENEWLVAKFHHGFSFWLYALFCLALLLVVRFGLPETKGRTLEEIERHWQRSDKLAA